MRRLLIVSHTPHYLNGSDIVGWGPTVREIDYLAELFDEVVHVAPLHQETVPASSLSYQSQKVRFVSVPSAGGSFTQKLKILAVAPSYIGTILREMKKADVVHVRCPANISLIAVLLLSFSRKPNLRWTKYAGNWSPKDREPLSYSVQRWLLDHNFHKGFVTVNGEWPRQKSHVFPFYNPSLTREELLEAKALSEKKQLTDPIQILFVGRLDEEKGVERSLRIVQKLRLNGQHVTLELVGDGARKKEFENLVNSQNMESFVKFHGWLPRTSLPSLYSRSHILLLPTSSSEGWPKVLSEAMAYGAVPLSSDVSSIPQYLNRFGTGRSISPGDLNGYVDAIAWYIDHPSDWKRESENGVQASKYFGYDHYLESVQKILNLGNRTFAIEPPLESKSSAFQK